MNAAEMTFGIEIECCMPDETDLPFCGYHNGYQVRWLPAGWMAQADMSIVAPVGFRSVEIVSPVLKGAEGIQQVMTVLEALRGKGAKVNASCGFHVHVGFPDTSLSELARKYDGAAE